MGAGASAVLCTGVGVCSQRPGPKNCIYIITANDANYMFGTRKFLIISGSNLDV